MNITMQCCGVVLLIVVFYFYLCRKRIKLRTSRAFLLFGAMNLAALVLDILSIVLLTYQEQLPVWLVDMECKAYVSSIVLVTLLSFQYIFTGAHGDERDLRRVRISSGAIAAAGVILIFALPIYKSVEDPMAIFTYGPSVLCTYVFSVFFIINDLIILIFKRRILDIRRRNAMWTWMILWLVSAGIQFMFNELLLVGFAGSVGVLIVYLMLENPELNTDTRTGMFNNEGLMLYTEQLLRSGKEFSVIGAVLPISLTDVSNSGERGTVRLEIINHLLLISDAYTFLYKDDEAVIVFENKEKAAACLTDLKKRFESGWGKSGNTIIKPNWISIPNGNIARKSSDIVQLLDFAASGGISLLKDDTVVIDDAVLSTMLDEKRIEALIMDALENDRVEVFYQPIYSTHKKRCTAAEALVRIRDREGKIVPPGDFINIAEHNGSILKLGEMVFEKVCRFLRDKDPVQYGLEYIEVNLSMVQCSNDKLAEQYIEIMQRYGIPARRINLEITESASVEAKKVLLENMNTLIDYGVTFSLDDFGTGQSNLNYIVDMPVDIVKFDRSMILSYFENGKAKYVMDAAMRMIHGMKLHIVSEGIETKEQLDVMLELGIDYIQGYYFSKPLPEAEYVEFLEKNNV